MKRILVVDDESDCRELVKQILEGEGYSVFPAKNGEEGLHMAQEDRPALVILDVQMPKKDGFSVFNDLRKEPNTADIPIIMLTGIGQETGIHFSKSDMGELFGQEPTAYIEKPIEPTKLIEEVTKAIGDS